MTKVTAFIVLILSMLLPTTSFAQRSTQTPVEERKIETDEALKPIADQFGQNVVQIFNEHRHLVNGTIVSKTGLVVTKLSEIGSKPLQCRFHDSRVFPAKLVARFESDDVAILKVSAPTELLKPVSLEDNSSLAAGKFVVAVGSGEEPTRMGIVSVDRRSEPIRQPECTDCIDVGLTGNFVQFYPAQRTEVRSGILITRVYPRSVAEDCGLLVGDIIEKIQDFSVYGTDQFEKYFRTLKPGYGARLTVHRKGEVLKPLIAMPRHSKRILHDRWGGGPFNRRRFGFTEVIIHDVPILPDECGSPLVDIHGNVLGINIARSLRTSTLAIPASRIKLYLQSTTNPAAPTQPPVRGIQESLPQK